MAAADQIVVSAVMPTANRRAFVPRALRWFQRQTYAAAELVVLDDGEDPVANLMPVDDPRVRYIRLDRRVATLGQKRNLIVAAARGDLIVHWDDDDWSAPDRLAVQVERMADRKVDICGLAHPLYYDSRSKQAWRYKGADVRPGLRWLYGICYRRSEWKKHPFRPQQRASDTMFLYCGTPGRQALVDDRLAVCMVHTDNVSPKSMEDGLWQSVDVGEVQKVVGEDWREFSGTSGLVLR